jgi:hypothetical protein
MKALSSALLQTQGWDFWQCTNYAIFVLSAVTLWSCTQYAISVLSAVTLWSCTLFASFMLSAVTLWSILIVMCLVYFDIPNFCSLSASCIYVSLMILRLNSDNYVQGAVVFYSDMKLILGAYLDETNALNDVNILRTKFQMEAIYHAVRPSTLVRSLLVIGRSEFESKSFSLSNNYSM